MKHELPPLPYPKTALEPHISAETLEYHHGKHHAKYVATLNELIPGTEFEDASLEEIIERADGKIFNNAAQVWNHAFYWNCLAPGGGGDPTGDLAQTIQKQFGSVDQFRQKFSQSAMSLFGSGWTWLVRRPDGTLAIENGANAKTPIVDGTTVPLLACDVWEHAYYIDYRNDRAKYLEVFWKLVNWSFVAERYRTRAREKTRV
jgi:superoxide dismutase, Fe-Mn family